MQRIKILDDWLKDTNDIDVIIDEFYEGVKGLLKYTSYFAVVKRGRSVTFYPAGSKLLDEQTIDKALEGLEDYSSAAESYERALTNYQNDNNERELLDNLRLSIEKLLKKLLRNSKPLEKQKTDLAIRQTFRGRANCFDASLPQTSSQFSTSGNAVSGE